MNARKFSNNHDKKNTTFLNMAYEFILPDFDNTWENQASCMDFSALKPMLVAWVFRHRNLDNRLGFLAWNPGDF